MPQKDTEGKGPGRGAIDTEEREERHREDAIDTG